MPTRRLLLRRNAGPVGYEDALRDQRAAVARIAGSPDAPYELRVLEHREVLTLGRAFLPAHLPLGAAWHRARGTEVVEVDRGGSVTWHGPGQLVVYLHVHLRELGLPFGRYFRDLEQWVTDVLAGLGLPAGRREGLTGVWTAGGKVCAMGVAAKGFVTWHGLSLNVAPDLSAYGRIVPCGLTLPVTSLERELGAAAPSLAACEEVLLARLPPWLAGLEQVRDDPA